MQILTPRAIRRVPTPLWALVFAIGCVLLTVAPTSATSGTTISVGSASRQLGQTATTSVSVSLNASDALTGYDVTLSYNPAIVSPTSVSFGSWTPLSTCGNQSPPNCTSGSFRVAAFQLNACSGYLCAVLGVMEHSRRGQQSDPGHRTAAFRNPVGPIQRGVGVSGSAIRRHLGDGRRISDGCPTDADQSSASHGHPHDRKCVAHPDEPGGSIVFAGAVLDDTTFTEHGNTHDRACVDPRDARRLNSHASSVQR